MTAGIVLLIVGAVFTFALRTDGSWIDTRVLGVILMLGGLAFIARARAGRTEVLATREQTDGEEPEVVERRVVVQRRVD